MRSFKHSLLSLVFLLFGASMAIAMPGGGGGGGCGPADNCSSAPSLTLNTVYSYDNSGCDADTDCDPPSYPICGCAPCGNEDCNASVMGMSCFIEGAFCGSPENTSWARFCPTTTTSYTFTVSNISCSGGGASLQFGVYSAGVVCGSNTQSNIMSCTGGATTTTSYTHTLTAGQCYLIVFDGNAGAACTWNFQITGVLPVTLANFDVLRQQRDMRLSWATSYENNAREFHVVRRHDNLQWEEGLSKDELYNRQDKRTVAVVTANNRSAGGTYSFTDAYVVDPGLYVYELYEKDMEGAMNYLGSTEAYVDVPTQARVTNTFAHPDGSFQVEVEVKSPALLGLEVYDISGKRASHLSPVRVNPGTYKLPVDLRQQAPGVYLYEVNINGERFRGKLLRR